MVNRGTLAYTIYQEQGKGFSDERCSEKNSS